MSEDENGLTPEQIAIIDGKIAEGNDLRTAIGEYILSAAGADMALSRLIAMITSLDDWRRVYLLVADRMPGAKLEMIKAVVPAEWGDAKPLFATIRRVNEYRNRLAHSTMDIHIPWLSDPDPERPAWEFKRERVSDGYHLSSADLARELLYVKALDQTYFAMTLILATGALKLGVPVELSDVVRNAGAHEYATVPKDLFGLIFPSP